MKRFFWFETEYPVESGFSIFGPCHLAWLFVIVSFICVSSKWYSKMPKDKQRKVNHVVGIGLPLMEIYRDAVLIATGYWNCGFLPLHLCSMALVVGMIYAFTEWRFFGVVYVLLCVPGAVAALLFPNWTAYPFFSYMHLHAFIAHGLTVAFGIWLLVSRRVVPTWKDFWMPVVFGLVGMVVIYPVNRRLDTNYWFLTVPSKGSPLEMIWQKTGAMWYLVGYAGFCMVIMALWLGIITFVSWWRQRKNSG